MQVIVLYNAPTVPPDHPDAESERAVVENAEMVADILREGDFDVRLLGINDDPDRLLDALKELSEPVIFNLYEGAVNEGETEAYAQGLMEWIRVPYTGCPSQSAVLCRNKPRAKALLRGAGMPTPAWVSVDSLPTPEWKLQWPAIVKPAQEDASVGVEQESVVRNQRELDERVQSLMGWYPPLLVEEFIDGRELNVAVIENPQLKALPVSEIVFDRRSGFLPIVTYNSKWEAGSPEDLASRPRCPADLPPALEKSLSELAIRAFHLFCCRDYARVDFRVDPEGNIYVLEVNPNPDYHPESGLGNGLRAAGIDFKRFTHDLVRQAASRQTRP